MELTTAHPNNLFLSLVLRILICAMIDLCNNYSLLFSIVCCILMRRECVLTVVSPV